MFLRQYYKVLYYKVYVFINYIQDKYQYTVFIALYQTFVITNRLIND